MKMNPSSLTEADFYGASVLDWLSSVWNFLTVGVFQSLGFGKYALLFAVMRKLVLEIPALLILNAIFPLYGLAYAQFTAELILGVCAILMLRYIFRKYGNNIKTTTDPS